jgi:hypothetical protein
VDICMYHKSFFCMQLFVYSPVLTNISCIPIHFCAVFCLWVLKLYSLHSLMQTF